MQIFSIRRGHPAHLVEDISRETGDGNAEEAEHYDEQSVIVQLSARVQDGTRCRSGSLDMCIQGKCQVRHIWAQFIENKSRGVKTSGSRSLLPLQMPPIALALCDKLGTQCCRWSWRIGRNHEDATYSYKALPMERAFAYCALCTIDKMVPFVAKINNFKTERDI